MMKPKPECPFCGRTDRRDSLIGRVLAGAVAGAILGWCAVGIVAAYDALARLL